jgi:dihydrofolate reductase
MSTVRVDITMSLDGFVAGPRATLQEPLGEGGERLHQWVYELAPWREKHGLTGGTTNADAEVLEESLSNVGAYVMGRRMFSGGEGPWESDPNADSWFGDEPPFHAPVFVVTHHAREPLVREGTTFTFVTDGVEATVEQAREAAGGKDVQVSGGASVAQQCLAAGLVGELQVHVAPLLLGDGVRLFDRLGAGRVALEQVRAAGPLAVAHLKYRVVR